MYFADLTPYVYFVDSCRRPEADGFQIQSDDDVLNIGWLDPSRPFPTGDVDPAVTEALLDASLFPTVNKTRGWHYCRFCPPDADDPTTVNGKSGPIGLGTSELWVRARQGLVFAAPDLIYHYITTHKYRPPDEFLAAVQRHIGSLSEGPRNPAESPGLCRSAAKPGERGLNREL